MTLISAYVELFIRGKCPDTYWQIKRWCM